MANNDICNLVGGGLVCDNPNCDYCDQSIEIKDYKNYINKPCPKCGENLLTQEDYDKTMCILDLVNAINKSAEKIEKNNSCNEQIKLTINVHTNTVNIEK